MLVVPTTSSPEQERSLGVLSELLPASRVFRGKFVAGLKTAFHEGRLEFYGNLAALADPRIFTAWLRLLFRHDWIVYAKPPFGGPEHALRDLSGYTRIALPTLCREHLSAVGVYGVFAYSVTQRMGIRLALVASLRGLLGLIVMQAARLIALGGILGVITALLLSKLLASMLVGVKPHDAISFSLAWILMTAVALLASTIPASHAARTDLVSVLHSE